MECGREQNGAKASEGVCAAYTETRLDGVNGGKNGGRACWPIVGTFCGGKVQDSPESKLENCMKCEFYQLVGIEEETNRQDSKNILEKLR